MSMVFDGPMHAVRFIKQGLPAHVEQELVETATANGFKAVYAADQRR